MIWHNSAMRRLMMGLTFAAVALAGAVWTPRVRAQIAGEPMTPSDTTAATVLPPTFFRARVLTVEAVRVENDLDQPREYQRVRLVATSGPLLNQELTLEHGEYAQLTTGNRVSPGELVIVVQTGTADNPIFFIADKYRLPALFLIVCLFFGLVITLSRGQGVSSILGMVFSILVLARFVVPFILQGYSPLLVTVTGAFLIATISLLLAHGYHKRTRVALVSTLLTLIIAALIAIIFVELAKLFGLGSEEASFLQFAGSESLNLKGLLLGGIIIGTLGVLDDITTAQTAAVDEIRAANPKLSKTELYRRGISVGKEHIASLVNTLVLAYAGASLPLFLLFFLNDQQPFWVTLNSEFIAEEVVRTLVGSTALVVAVPLSTALAAHFLHGDHRPSRSSGHSHH